MGRTHLHSSSGISLPRKGRRRVRGYKTFVDANGTIHVVPRPAERWALPLGPILIFAGLVLAFKSLAMLNVGLNDYVTQLSALGSGTAVEKGAAFLLQPDPASMWLYDTLRPLMI